MSLPRIEKIEFRPDTVLRFKLRNEQRWREAKLAGLASRYDALRPLLDVTFFRSGQTIDWGAGVGWPGDRDIAAGTVLRLSEEQSRFTAKAFKIWQARVKLSNSQAAEALGLSLGTVKNYRGGADIPAAVGIACRAMESDPAVLAAHLVPRRPGRPKSAE